MAKANRQISNLGRSLARKVNKKFANKFRKFELLVAKSYKMLAARAAPTGENRDARGTPLKTILENLEVEKRGTRTGVNAILTKGRGALKVTLEIRAGGKSEAQKILWVNNGTGIYGPENSPIVPKKKGGLLKWKDGNGVWHFAKEVRGQKPQKFLEEAAKELLSRLRSGVMKL